MHIAEGYLAPLWVNIWLVFSIPIIIYGMYRLNKLVSEKRELVPLIAVVGAFVFVLSALKLPSITGSSTHPTGTGMAAILFGPAITSVLGLIVLVFQAMLLGHGGMSTLGANIASMGIIGPLVAYVLYKTLAKTRINFYLNVFLATAFADWATYIVTSVQLALSAVYPSMGSTFSISSFMFAFSGFAGAFAFTQVPIAILEGALTALIMKYVVQIKSSILLDLKVLTSDTVDNLKEGLYEA